MGAFYVNYLVKGSNQNAVVRAMAKRKAYVSAERNGYVHLFDEASDRQDEGAIAKLASQLSAILKSTVLAVMNHDSDILWYQLYERGVLTDHYNSTPDYWSSKPDPAPPEGGDANRFCAAFHCKDVAAVSRVLRTPTYTFAEERHRDLFQALGLPELAVEYGFGAIENGYLPQGVSKQDFFRTQ